MPSRLLEYIPEQTGLKELLWNFHKIKVCGGVFILKMVRMFLFTAAVKTAVLIFQKYYQIKQRQ